MLTMIFKREKYKFIKNIDWLSFNLIIKSNKLTKQVYWKNKKINKSKVKYL